MELLYVVCQIAAGSVCEEHSLPMHGAGPVACLFSAQAELAREVRPGWRVERWRCGEALAGSVVVAGPSDEPQVTE